NTDEHIKKLRVSLSKRCQRSNGKCADNVGYGGVDLWRVTRWPAANEIKDSHTIPPVPDANVEVQRRARRQGLQTAKCCDAGSVRRNGWFGFDLACRSLTGKATTATQLL